MHQYLGVLLGDPRFALNHNHTTNAISVQLVDVFEAMNTCRAIRYFKPDPVDDELINKVINAAIRAPSPGNSQGRDFVVVTDVGKRGAIGDAVGEALIETVVAMPRPDRMHRLMLQGAEHLLKTFGSCPVLILVCGKAIYPYSAPSESYIWSAVYPAAQNLIVSARALGLGTVLTTFHDAAEPVIRETLNIPNDVFIGCIIPMGWPDAKFGPVNRIPIEQTVHRDGWQGDLR